MRRSAFTSAIMLFLAATSAMAQEIKPRLDGLGEPLPAGVVVRMGTLRFRSDHPVRHLQFSKDGNILLGDVMSPGSRLWDVRTGKTTAPFHGKILGNDPSLSPDGKLLVDLTDKGNVRLWDLAAGKMVRMWGNEKQPANGGFVASGAYFSTDGKILVIHGTQGKEDLIRRFDLKAQESMRVHQLPDGTSHQVTVSPDGRFLFGVHGDDKVASLLDLDTGKKLHAFDKTDEDNGLAHVFTPDGKMLVRLTGDQSAIMIWDTATGKLLRQLENGRLGYRFFRTDMFSPDSKWIAVNDSSDINVLVYELATGKLLRTFCNGPGQHQRNCFSPDSKRLATSSDGRADICVWEVATGKKLCHVDFELGDSQSGGAIAFSPDGNTLAFSSGRLVKLVDLTTGKEIHPAIGHQEPAVSLAFSPDGKMLASSGTDRVVSLWDADTGNEVQRLTKIRDTWGNAPGRVTLAFTPAGKPLAALSFLEAVSLWDVRTGKVVHEFDDVGSWRGDGIFSADARRLAAPARHGDIHLWNAITGKRLHRLAWYKPEPDEDAYHWGKETPVLAFAPDGRTFAALGLSRPREAYRKDPKADPYKPVVRVWELATGKDRMRFDFDERSTEGFVEWATQPSGFDYPAPLSLTYAPDSKTLAIGSRHTLHLYDATNGKEVRRFGRPKLNARAAVFSPDGKRLAAPDEDGMIFLWDAATATLLGEFACQSAHSTVLAFSPDSKRLAAGNSDATVMIWDIEHLLKKRVPNPKELEVAWQALADPDAARAFQAIAALTAHPHETLAMLKERMPPPASIDTKRVDQLLTDLGSDQFAVRQKAARELEKLADVAEPALKSALARVKRLEERRRIEELLRTLEEGDLASQSLQTLRAIEVLERIGTAEARRLLETQSKGLAGCRATEAAALALERLAKRAR